jgi:hypothetical protein
MAQYVVAVRVFREDGRSISNKPAIIDCTSKAHAVALADHLDGFNGPDRCNANPCLYYRNEYGSCIIPLRDLPSLLRETGNDR